ncbi:MAG: DUF1360 domain-containing protein [Actinomycetota bacterium]|jgi:hypothetical protein|nr:DUF1360 domain-containing protein [Acidothermales bacterium]MDQ3431656.1 DUF1360 domain-containing protein [Actinomycetota bacterium]
MEQQGARGLRGVSATARRVGAAYAGDAERPLRAYSALLGSYGAAAGGLAALAGVLGKRPPERITPWDVWLIGMATHKVSRLLAKDPVTSPLRAPFTRFEGLSGEAELAEQARGHGAQHAIGELLTCPFCVGQWIATGFSAGLVFAPRLSRLTAATFASLAVADILQFAYTAVEQRAG